MHRLRLSYLLDRFFDEALSEGAGVGEVDWELHVAVGALRRLVKERDVVATYNLFYNAAMFVEAGLGSAICIDGVVPHEFASRVVVRPFSVALTSDVYLAWRKNAALSPAAAALVETVRVLSSGRQT